MIKYLGSKRALVGVLGRLADASGAATAVDLFTGTTRVAQEFCRRGLTTTAVDVAAYSHVLAGCYVEADADRVDQAEVAVVPGEAFGPSGYIRMSYALGDDQLLEGVQRLQRLFAS